MSRLAIVTGSNGPAWETQLRFASKDAEQIADCLAKECGFDVASVPPTADAHDVMREITRISASCQRTDDLLIYFSGHGVLDRGRLFLLWNNTSRTIFDSAVNARHIVDALEFSAAAHKLLVLDCCHAGSAVGFKGGDLQPFLSDGGSQLVLCAGSRLELAREFDHLGASFMTHHIRDILNNRSKAHVSLGQLVEELRKRADAQNSRDPIRRVPVPYLFGEQRSPFVIKRPQGPTPVEVAIHSLFVPEMSLLRETLAPYLKWNITYILNSLPVNVSMPPEFVARVATLNKYLSSDSWPCKVADRTKEQAREVAERLLPALATDLQRAVRVVVAATSDKDNEVYARAREVILEWYIKAKVFATARVLQAFWLHGEPYEDWIEPLKTLDEIWSNQLVSGLSWVAQEKYTWAFWTDADWRVDDKLIRVFIPQKFGRREYELEELTHDDWWRLLIPQLIAEGLDRGLHYYTLSRLLTLSTHDLKTQLSIRGELVIDTESHISPISAAGRNPRAEQLVAGFIAEHLKGCPRTEWQKELFKLTGWSLLDGVHKRVLALMPELRDES